MGDFGDESQNILFVFEDNKIFSNFREVISAKSVVKISAGKMLVKEKILILAKAFAYIVHFCSFMTVIKMFV